MKVVIINKSDTTGGAAIVSYRLMESLVRGGIDAKMLVTEKLRESGHIALADSQWKIREAFIKERLGILISNGMRRDTLFKIDTASEGLPLYRHPWIKEADVICLNWVNQGMLSLSGLVKLGRLGKPMVWTMHDQWNMTGICHHSGSCTRWETTCGNCPLLGRKAAPNDLSARILERKIETYATLRSTLPHGSESRGIAFVAVSNWLAEKARKSALLCDADLHVIPNAFPFTGDEDTERRRNPSDKVRILFGAARLDDPIKGLPVMVEASRILAKKYPSTAYDCEIVTFGSIRNPEALSGIGIDHRHLGILRGYEVRTAYEQSDIVLSTSRYETLPGTLVEGQAWGCVPVATLSGGQPDIVEHGRTGYLVAPGETDSITAERIADGIEWAYKSLQKDSAALRRAMLLSAKSRFAGNVVAAQYIALFNRLLNRR